MEIEDKDVKIKMSICPECGNAFCVAVEHMMSDEDKVDFFNEVKAFNLDVKTISLEEYRNSNVTLYCKENCSKKK